jgi:hypothetical protein
MGSPFSISVINASTACSSLSLLDTNKTACGRLQGENWTLPRQQRHPDTFTSSRENNPRRHQSALPNTTNLAGKRFQVALDSINCPPNLRQHVRIPGPRGANDPEIESIPGRDPAMMYILASWTGFRKGEIGSLTLHSLRLDDDSPTATMDAILVMVLCFSLERVFWLRPPIAAAVAMPACFHSKIDSNRYDVHKSLVRKHFQRSSH